MTANSRVVRFGPPPSGTRPKDTFYSLATKMLRDTLRKDQTDWFMIAHSLSTCSKLSGAGDYTDEIIRLGYQQYGCFECGSKQLPQTFGLCQHCCEQKRQQHASSTKDNEPDEPPTLKPLKYAAWRAPELPKHSGLVDLKTATYYSRLLVCPVGYTHRAGLKIEESQYLKGYKEDLDATKPLPGFFIRNQTTGITKSYAQKEVARVMQMGAKKNLDALFQVRIELDHEQGALEEIARQLCFVDRVIQKGHMKGQVRAIFRNLERYQARRG